ncbi:spore-associated protein A [Nonomuraea antimicrobica]|uniref:Spore-associated protein A n=1 Tax=Nonomuraea antimicrobica TaxID=561173 RepID=A0ABP7CLY5_9ACTN
MLFRTIIAAALAAAGIAAVPSAAYATSAAYTPERVCGKGFHRVDDGHRAMKTREGAVFGRVYLLYNKRTGKNCVAAIKTAYTGTRTLTGASIEVKGGGQSKDARKYRYYAETGHIDGAWKCVKYAGWTRDPSGRVEAWGGRTSWNNCAG